MGAVKHLIVYVVLRPSHVATGPLSCVGAGALEVFIKLCPPADVRHLQGADVGGENIAFKVESDSPLLNF